MAELLEIILLCGARTSPLPLPPVGLPQVKKHTMAVQSSTPPSSSFFHWFLAVLTWGYAPNTAPLITWPAAAFWEFLFDRNISGLCATST